METNKPIITIGMPVFNDIEYIEESLNSVLNQSFTDFELIISDDGSTDGSGDFCKEFAKKDARIKYYRQPKNLGISKNMEWLLNQSSAKYFVWAGDDDLMDKNYLQTLFNLLENNPNCISAFSPCQLIDNEGEPISDIIQVDYSNPHVFKRVKNYIVNATDYFGYGMFVREKIKNVKFPIWWWPNKATPYNNIYPTLAYYLCQGDFIISGSEPLFFKRVKPASKVNHKLTGKNNAIKESFAHWIRKFNLVCFTLSLINRSKGFIFSLRSSPFLFHYWFIVPSWKQFILASSSFFKNRIKK